MIYDCFTFLNELDLLEIRLRELDPVVDYFILVESPVTFSGNPKPLYYQDNKERFKLWADKIISYIPPNMPQGPNAWEREDYSREQFKVALHNHLGNWRLTAEDIITICDVDEIPSRSAISRASQYHLPHAAFHLRDYRYKANLRNRFDWYGAKVVNGEFFDAHTVKECRYSDNFQDKIIRDAGWHLTYQGDLTQIKYKCDSFSHHDDVHKPDMYERFEKYGPVLAERAMLEWESPDTLPSIDLLLEMGWLISMDEWREITAAPST